MTGLGYIPNDLRKHLPNEVIEAIDELKQATINEIEAFFQLETGEFIGLGFVGPDDRFTRPANPETLAALKIIENQYKIELKERARGINIWWQE